MVVIIDSGSTKSDWLVLNNDNTECCRVEEIGLNPNFITDKDLRELLAKNEVLNKYKNQLQKVYFYGAGCSLKKAKNLIKKELKFFFLNAEVFVEHDVLGAAYASYYGEPNISCILGTGSNSCYFDGKKERDDTPSLGYVIGDEGSGNDLGKRLLKHYIQGKLPKEVSLGLEKEFGLDYPKIIENIYKKPFPNRFLASFSVFVKMHKHIPIINDFIESSFSSFFENQVLLYPEAKNVEINFVGSVAYHFQDELRKVGKKMGLNVNKIISKPIDRLAEYHRNHIR